MYVCMYDSNHEAYSLSTGTGVGTLRAASQTKAGGSQQ